MTSGRSGGTRDEPRSTSRYVLWAGILASLCVGPALAQPSETVVEWLHERFGLEPRDGTRLARGAPATLVLDSRDDREVALLGAVRIGATPDAYLARLRDIARFKRGRHVESIGVFSTPPAARDLDALALLPNEARALRSCRPGDCALQVSRAMLDARARMAADVDERTAHERAFRTALLSLVREYLHTGLRALPTYVDDDHQVHVAHEARRVIEDETRLLPHLPAWRQRLLHPEAADDAVTTFVYWSRERIGRASVVSITHVMIGPADQLRPGARLAASLQLYASHYFDASLGLTVLWPEGTRSTLVYYNRSRVDTFDGLVGGIVKSMVRSRAHDALEGHLLDLQQRMSRSTN